MRLIHRRHRLRFSSFRGNTQPVCDRPIVRPPIALGSGKPARVFTTTMGASQDLLSEGTRRMLVNACYWAVGMEGKIPDKSDVTIVGDCTPLPFSFGAHKKGVTPSDLAGE
jgi:hypothetical protein